MINDNEKNTLLRMVFDKLFSHDLVQSAIDNSPFTQDTDIFIPEGYSHPGAISGNDSENADMKASKLSSEPSPTSASEQQIRLLWHVREYFFYQALNAYIIDVFEEHVRKMQASHAPKQEHPVVSHSPSTSISASTREQSTPAQAPQSVPVETSNVTIPVSPSLHSTNSSHSNFSRNWRGNICMVKHACVEFLIV
jgi:hypothetical protein